MVRHAYDLGLIDRARLERGFSWHALGKAAHVSSRTLYEGLSGQRTWREGTVLKLASALGIELSSIVRPLVTSQSERDRSRAGESINSRSKRRKSA